MEETKSTQSEQKTTSLIQSIASDLQLLVGKEVALGKAESSVALETEAKVAKILLLALIVALVGLSIGLCALGIGLIGFKMTAALGFSLLALSFIPGYIGYRQRITNPVPQTRATVKENLQWIKDTLGKTP
jgi:hypothetical protein